MQAHKMHEKRLQPAILISGSRGGLLGGGVVHKLEVLGPVLLKLQGQVVLDGLKGHLDQQPHVIVEHTFVLEICICGQNSQLVVWVACERKMRLRTKEEERK